jgi:signal transduction histidine kinase
MVETGSRGMLRSVSIKWKAVFGVVLVTLTVLGLVSAIQMHYTRQDLTRMLSEQHFAAASRMAKDIDTRLETSRDVLARLASGFPAELLQNQEAARGYFRARPALLASFDDVIVMMPNGDVVADFPESTNPVAPIVPDHSDIEKLTTTLKPVISQPAFTPRHADAVLQILVPILDKERKLAAVLIGVLRLQNRNLLGELAAAKIGKSGVFLIVTKEQTPRFVVHPDKKMILQPRPANAAASTLRALQGFEGSAEDVASSGTPTLYSYKSLKAVNWLLLAVVPLEEAFAPIKDSERRIWLITMLVCVLVVPLVWSAAWVLLSPLSALRDQIEKLRGKHSGHAPVSADRQDEIGDLARTFNSLMQERSAAEAALIAHRDQLNNMVTERTKDLQLAKEHAEDAKDVAERANQAKSEFLSNMSHELRTPMHAISSFAKLGLDKVDAGPRDKLQRYFHNIDASAVRLNHLLDDLLDLAKTESGKMTYTFAQHDICAILRSSMAEFKAMADARGVVLETRDDAGQAMAEVDEVRITQVFANLLSNAIKFSPAGGAVTARVTAESGEQGAGRVVVVFADHGPGIPPAELELIFDKFVQSSKTKTGAGGTGLGLPIARELLSAHGGTVSAANRPDGGAEFRIELPASQTAPRAIALEESELAVETV